VQVNHFEFNEQVNTGFFVKNFELSLVSYSNCSIFALLHSSCNYALNFNLVIMEENNYLTDMPDEFSKYGLCKTLAVRREIIHIKHIFTEIFVRKTIDIEKYLSKLDMSIFGYVEVMTNRIRKVHHFSRQYSNNLDKIVKDDRDRFFPTLELFEGLKNCIVLDFDGVTTENNFKELYELCCLRNNVHICSANPTIEEDWFRKKSMSVPDYVHSMKGKVEKIKKLIDVQKKHDYVFYVDNEIEYLEYAWVFGVQTYHWNGREIKYFTMKTK